MHLSCRLVDQCTQTLNLMRRSGINPRLRAEAKRNGAFDYNKTPLAPTGTKVLIHETPNRRRKWAIHGVDGWYLGGARGHYYCYRFYTTKTRAERITCTVEFSALWCHASALLCRCRYSSCYRPLLGPPASQPPKCS
jgi:hypothetical protein